MSTLAESFEPAQRFVFWHMADVGYRNILHAVGEKRLRHTYDNHVLEIMSSSRNHEYFKKFLCRLVHALTFELKIPIQSLGSITLSTKDFGIEPDDCFFLEQELDCTRDEYWNPEVDPAPELVLEIVAPGLFHKRLPIFAKLKVREVWTFDGLELKFWKLVQHEFQLSSHSIAFPFLNAHDLVPYIEQLVEMGESTLLRKFVAWLHTVN